MRQSDILDHAAHARWERETYLARSGGGLGTVDPTSPLAIIGLTALVATILAGSGFLLLKAWRYSSRGRG